MDDGESRRCPPPPVALCSPTATWGTGGLLALSTTADDELDTVTPDELQSRGPGHRKLGDHRIRRRASSTDAFGAPQLRCPPVHRGRVSLSPDGLRLVVVNADAQGFSELTRSEVAGNIFGAPSRGQASSRP